MGKRRQRPPRFGHGNDVRVTAPQLGDTLGPEFWAVGTYEYTGSDTPTIEAELLYNNSSLQATPGATTLDETAKTWDAHFQNCEEWDDCTLSVKLKDGSGNIVANYSVSSLLAEAEPLVDIEDEPLLVHTRQKGKFKGKYEDVGVVTRLECTLTYEGNESGEPAMRPVKNNGKWTLDAYAGAIANEQPRTYEICITISRSLQFLQKTTRGFFFAD